METQSFPKLSWTTTNETKEEDALIFTRSLKTILNYNITLSGVTYQLEPTSLSLLASHIKRVIRYAGEKKWRWAFTQIINSVSYTKEEEIIYTITAKNIIGSVSQFSDLRMLYVFLIRPTIKTCWKEFRYSERRHVI